MSDRDSLSKLLSRHRGIADRSRDVSPSTPLLDDHSLARILDASLGVLAAVRTLTDVTEDVVRGRLNRILERAATGKTLATDRHQATTRERIPLTY